MSNDLLERHGLPRLPLGNENTFTYDTYRAVIEATRIVYFLYGFDPGQASRNLPRHHDLIGRTLRSLNEKSPPRLNPVMLQSERNLQTFFAQRPSGTVAAYRELEGQL